MGIRQSHQVTRDNLAGRRNVTTVVKVNRSDAVLDELPLRIQTQKIGNAFILGHTVNGVLGTANGVNGSQITLGTAGYGALDTVAVVNHQNTFREYFRGLTFFDSANTSATINASNYQVDFSPNESLRSEIIFTDGGKELVEATFITTGGTSTITSGSLSYYLSPDDGSNWETVSLGTAHRFTNTGTALR